MDMNIGTTLLSWEISERSMTAPMLLGLMRQQAAIAVSEEDWTGTSCPVERRRRQNRINQRLYRRRQESHSQPGETRRQAGRRDDILKRAAVDAPDLSTDSKETKRGTGPSPDYGSTAQALPHEPPQFEHSGSRCDWTSADAQKLIKRFEDWGRRRRHAACPRPEHLFLLVKFNVWRALVYNTFTLGLTLEHTAPDDALSPFNTMSPCVPRCLPPALHPTAIQRQVAHHPWIDLLPFPGVRDNLIRAGDLWDDEELCSDLVGFYSQSSGRLGLIVWGEPWDPRGWEATEEFVGYWGWVIEGCREIMESTNYWRARRGEEPLTIAPKLADIYNEVTL